MEMMMRKMAIDAVGDAPWGTHFCQFYQTKEDLTNLLVPFLKAGLENNEFCMWITSEPLIVEEAKNALNTEVKNLDDYIKKGQMEILDSSRWYTKAGYFDTDEVLQAWLAKEKQALENGFDGLRITGNISWLKKKDWKDFVDYEAILNRIIDNHQMLAVCTYCIDKCTASEIIDVLSNHQFALAKRQGTWEIIESPKHKKITEMLHDIDKQYMALCHNIPGMVYRGRHDWSTDIISNSEAVCGYSNHEFRPGQIKWLDIVHPDDKQRVLQETGELEQKRKFIVQQYRIIDKDGSVRWVEDHKASRFTDTGTFLGVDGVAFDITKRKKTEEVLRLWNKAIHASINGLAIAELDGKLSYVNPSFLEMWGYDEENEVLGKAAVSFWQEKEQAENIVRSINTQKGWVGELTAQKKDGSFFDVQISATVVRNSAGKPLCIMSSFIDISEHKKADKALKESEDRYKALFQGAAEGILVADVKTKKFKYANPAICKMLGYTEEEMIGMGVRDIYPKENLEYVFSEFEAQARGNKTLSQSIPCLRKDGTIIYANINTTNIMMDSRECNVGFFADITQRKQAEAELEEYKDEVHRTQKYAYISSMGAIIAHQLNQPLNMINMLLGKALEQGKKSFSPSVLKNIEKSLLEVGKTTSIINKFRQSFIGEALEVEGTANISSTAKKIISALSERAEYAKMRILVKGLDGLPEVAINKVAIEQMFFIIIQNAIEAAENKKRHKLNISGKLANGNIELQFSDNCCGIAPENLKKIFEPFFSTKPNGKGLGIGLVIIKQMLINYWGKIRVESQLGRGTTVYVTLPISNISKS